MVVITKRHLIIFALIIIGIVSDIYYIQSSYTKGSAANAENSMNPLWRDKMMTKGHKYMKIAQLNKLAIIKTSGAVPEQYLQSLPIPAVRPDGLRVLFLYCPTQLRPAQPVKMNPPRYILTLYAETGRLDELKGVTPKDFGQAHQPNEMIGTFATPDGITTDEFTQKTDRLFEIYDMLLPEFVARKTTVNDDIKHAANEFRQLFTLLSEPPLRPYYGSVGRDFFTWVDSIAPR